MLHCRNFHNYANHKRRNKMMDYSQMTKQVMDFQKISFTSWYDALSLLQDQANSAMDTMLEQSSWIPEEGRQAMSSWINVCQEERDRLKNYIDDSFSGIEKHVGTAGKPAPAKVKKAAI
jgi:hypothetical protein